VPVEQSIKVVEVVALGMDPPVVIDADTPLREVLQRMRDESSGCALITRENRLAGIFTERDLVARVFGNDGALEQPVADWMTQDPDRVTQSDPIRKAIRVMRRGGFRHVPIVDEEGGVVGCVRDKDIIDYLAEHFPEQVLNLPPDPDQIALEREGG
jgi:CBS domain-containing protein